MPRCSPLPEPTIRPDTGHPPRRRLLGLAGAFLALAATGSALAQVARPFPAMALRGDIVFGQTPEIELNGRPARLAPGARIRGTDNMIALPASLTGTFGTVNYTVEPSTGLVFEVWILRREEIARQPWPSTPQEAARWAFDPAAQTWTRR